MRKYKKELIIIRHAQAKLGSNSGLDSDRPLTSRGEDQAILMARRMMSYELKIDHLICSPALRTKMTALIFCREIGFQENKILYLDELYEGTLQNYLRVFSGITKNTAIIGHYPGVKDSGNWLCGKNFQDFPAAGMMHLRISSDQIVNISAGQGKLLRFEYPEMFET
tara:strand:+ start:443 stop:943 length:501 start_codon:yes stop_codon:yes gene_type:complete